MPTVLTMCCYHIEKILFAPINCVICVQISSPGIWRLPTLWAKQYKNPTFFFNVLT